MCALPIYWTRAAYGYSCMASARLAGGSDWPAVVGRPPTSTINLAIDVAPEASLCRTGAPRPSMDRCAAMRLDSTTFDDLVDPSWAAECLAAALPVCPPPQQFTAATRIHPQHATTQTLRGTKGHMRQLAPAPRQLSTATSQPACKMPPPSSTPAPSPLREQDRLLPMANIARLMSMELPADAKISRDAKILMQELVTEFICFFTSEANDLSLQNERKTIAKEDIYASIETLGARVQPWCVWLLARPQVFALYVFTALPPPRRLWHDQAHNGGRDAPLQ